MYGNYYLDRAFWAAYDGRKPATRRPIVQQKAGYLMRTAKNPRNEQVNQESMSYPGPGAGVSGESTN